MSDKVSERKILAIRTKKSSRPSSQPYQRRSGRHSQSTSNSKSGAADKQVPKMAPRDKVMRDMPPPEPHMKGGGQRGGPRRWTGTGPRPARHVPWPEIFKHHQSVITGHLKMLDMVRKHTVEGSGNYRTIMPMIDRCKEMLNHFRQVTTSFVPPKTSFDGVPLGSSSASMYPGYSPADHIYGEAAQEYGSEYSKAKMEGKAPQIDPNVGPEYIVGHAQQTKRKQLEEVQSKLGGSRRGSGSQPPTSGTSKQGSAPPVGDNPYFVIDSNPDPVEIPDRTSHKSKKVKTKHDSYDAAVPVVETEDISAEVEERLKEKREKKGKKDKKRKRDTEDSTNIAETAEAASVEPAAETASVEKPRRKKSKKAEDAAPVEEPVKVNGTEEPKEKKSKKEKNENKRAAEAEESVAANGGDRDAEVGKKKKRKKSAPAE